MSAAQLPVNALELKTDDTHIIKTKQGNAVSVRVIPSHMERTSWGQAAAVSGIESAISIIKIASPRRLSIEFNRKEYSLLVA